MDDLKERLVHAEVEQLLQPSSSPMRLFSLIEISHKETQIMLHFLSGLYLLETY